MNDRDAREDGDAGVNHEYNRMSGVVQCRDNPSGLTMTFGFAGEFNFCPFCGAELEQGLKVDSDNPPLIE